jgi:hypothetical protein
MDGMGMGVKDWISGNCQNLRPSTSINNMVITRDEVDL